MTRKTINVTTLDRVTAAAFTKKDVKRLEKIIAEEATRMSRSTYGMTLIIATLDRITVEEEKGKPRPVRDPYWTETLGLGKSSISLYRNMAHFVRHQITPEDGDGEAAIWSYVIQHKTRSIMEAARDGSRQDVLDAYAAALAPVEEDAPEDAPEEAAPEDAAPVEAAPEDVDALAAFAAASRALARAVKDGTVTVADAAAAILAAQEDLEAVLPDVAEVA